MEFPEALGKVRSGSGEADTTPTAKIFPEGSFSALSYLCW